MTLLSALVESREKWNSDSPAQIFIAHQGRIPSYRVPFYELLEKLRPAHWEFRVAIDPAHFSESWRFKTQKIAIRRFGSLKWQNLTHQARWADVLILDTQWAHLSYPYAAMMRARETRLILWGHTHNLNVKPRSLRARISRGIKKHYLRTADQFFAYTPEQRNIAIGFGLTAKQVTILHNTVDIEAHRILYLENFPRRNFLRKKLGFGPTDRVALMVGRLIPERRLAFLLRAFRILAEQDDWHLIVIGDGPDYPLLQTEPNGRIIAPGRVTDPHELARYYTVTDVFVMPGMVGLAPVEALAYELPIIAVDLQVHSPEMAYLNEMNSVILPECTTPAQMADCINSHRARTSDIPSEHKYETVRHLTLDNMVRSFIEGVNRIL